MKYNCIKNSKSPEIIRARMRHGMIAYGIYVALMDCLEESNEYKLSKDYDMIAYEMRVDVSVVQSVIEDFGLFKIEGNYFYSPELTKYAEQAKKVSEVRSKAGRIGGIAKAKNVKQMPSKCQANATNSLANATNSLANATNSLANAKQMPGSQNLKEKRTENFPHTPLKENKKENLKEAREEKAELSHFTSSDRLNDFLNSLQPYISRYGQKLVDEFAAYWTCMSKDDTRMRFEKESKFSIAGRLATWSKNELRYKGNTVLSVFKKEKDYDIDWDKVLRWFNNLGLVKLKVLTDKRKMAYITMFEAHGKDGLVAFSENIKKSDYLQGKSPNGPQRDYDFVFNETNFAKIIEGSYNNFKHTQNGIKNKGWDAPQYDDTSKYRQGFGASNGK